jgi:hypothetical protein
MGISDGVCFEVYNPSQRTNKSEHVDRRHTFVVRDYIFIHSDLIPTKSVNLQLHSLLYNPHDRNISRMRTKKALRVCIN